MTTIIDKLDKIGWDGVKTELAKIGIEAEQFEQVRQLLSATTLAQAAEILAGNATAKTGIDEIQAVLDFNKNYQFGNRFELDFTLARGLNYYTGCIYEVVADTSAAGQEKLVMGSIASGGRYDNLTAIFGMPDVSGVGISFGADRIFDLLGELNLYPTELADQLKILVLSLDDEALPLAFDATQALRQAEIAADCYPQAAKFKKQMDYANRRDVPFIVIIGESERQTGLYGFKNMRTGEQTNLSISDIIATLKKP
jgi:histidyl-tRNA synthetase